MADGIRQVREVLEQTALTFEIVVADDGSADDTASAAAAAGVRVIRHALDRGHRAALERGIGAARYDWILITDADVAYPAESTSALLAAADHNDTIAGSRTGEQVAIPLERRRT